MIHGLTPDQLQELNDDLLGLSEQYQKRASQHYAAAQDQRDRARYGGRIDKQNSYRDAYEQDLLAHANKRAADDFFALATKTFRAGVEGIPG